MRSTRYVRSLQVTSLLAAILIGPAVLLSAEDASPATTPPVQASPGHLFWPRQGIAVGAYKLTNPERTPVETARQEMLRFRKLGFDYAWLDVWGVPEADHLKGYLRTADEVGLFLVPHLSTCISLQREVGPAGEARWKSPPDGASPPESCPEAFLYGIGEEHWAQRWEDGSIAYEGSWKKHPYPYADMWAPAARRAFRRTVRQALDLCRDHPCVRLVSYEDEFRYWHDFHGRRGFAMYSPWSQTVARVLAGRDVAAPGRMPPPGTVATGDDPFLALRYTLDPKFLRFTFTSRAIDFHVRDLSQVLHARSSGIADFYTYGAFGGQSDIALCRAYANELNKPVLCDAFNVDHALAARDERADLFVLVGWWSPRNNWPFFHRRLPLAARLVLMRGPESIAFASTPFMASSPPHREALREAIDDIRTFGPMFRNLTLRRHRIGLLWSDTTASTLQIPEVVADEQKTEQLRLWRWLEHQLAVIEQAYPALRQAGYLPRIVTETDVLNGDLENLDVLVMVNHQFSDDRLMRAYQAFVERGGKVLADQSAAALPDGATVLPLDAAAGRRAMEQRSRRWWGTLDERRQSYRGSMERIEKLAGLFRQALQPTIRPAFDVANVSPLILTEARGAGLRYLIALNTSLTDDLSTSVAFRHAGPVLDLTRDAEQVDCPAAADGLRQAKVHLKPGQWAIWMLADRPAGHVGAVLVTAEAPAAVRCQLWNDAGLPAMGVVPFCVTSEGQRNTSVIEHGLGDVWLPGGVGTGQDLTVEVLGQKIPVHRLAETRAEAPSLAP